MNNLKNSVQLIGHLGADPEIKTLDKGTTLAHIRVATSERFKNAKGEWQDDTQWHYCTLWEGLATKAQEYLKKGSYVMIQGRLIYRNYDDAQGVKKYVTEIRVNNFLILDKKPTSESTSTTTATAHSSTDNDDLPF